MLKAAVAPAEMVCYEGTSDCNSDPRFPRYLDGGGAVEESHEGGGEGQEDEIADHEGRAAEEDAGNNFETPGDEEKRTPPENQKHQPDNERVKGHQPGEGIACQEGPGIGFSLFFRLGVGLLLGEVVPRAARCHRGVRQTTALIISMSCSSNRLCRRAWMSTEDSPSEISSAVTLPAIGPIPMPRPLNPVQK